MNVLLRGEKKQMKKKLLKKDKFDESKILNDEEIKAIVFLAQKTFGRTFFDKTGEFDFSFENMLRFRAVSARCRDARIRLGLSIKETALKLKVPQYRIKAIENASVREIVPDALLKYVAFLGLEKWFHRWITANQALASKIGITDKC